MIHAKLIESETIDRFRRIHRHHDFSNDWTNILTGLIKSNKISANTGNRSIHRSLCRLFVLRFTILRSLVASSLTLFLVLFVVVILIGITRTLAILADATLRMVIAIFSRLLRLVLILL